MLSSDLCHRLRREDLRLLVLARTRGHDPARERAVATFSRAGEHAGCWIALGLTGAALDRAQPARRTAWLHDTAAVAGAFCVNTALKLAIRRPRPQLPGLPALTTTPTQLSFPSAHATTGFAAARLYAARLPATPLYALALALTLSRLYLGVHYPSDLLAGALLGTLVAVLTARGAQPCR